jgi:hypothetical protein
MGANHHIQPTELCSRGMQAPGWQSFGLGRASRLNRSAADVECWAHKGWVVPTSILPPIASNVLRVIRFLVFESNCVYVSPEQEERIKTVLARIEQIVGP